MVRFSYEFLPALVNMTLTASVATAVIVVLRSLVGKLPKIFFHCLWLVVLFRLLCPFSLSSDRSFFSLIAMPSNSVGENTSVMEYVPVDIVHNENPYVNIPAPFVSGVINEVLPKGEEQTVADPLEAPIAIATVIWLLGVVTVLCYGINSHFTLKKTLVGCIRLKDNIYITDYIQSPFVMGLIKPKIYLPSCLDEREKGYIILHEKHHIKRFDHVVKLLWFTALALHWFNPIVWLAFKLATRDIEMSCDEAVIKKLGNDIASNYSASLLNLATGKNISPVTPLAFGEGETASRIKNLAYFKSLSTPFLAFDVLLCIFIGFALFLNPNDKKGEIYYNGMVYSQNGKATDYLPDSSKEIGRLTEILAEDMFFADYTADFTGKGLADEYKGMPIFTQPDSPEYIYLTSGKGWIPFKAKSMDIKSTENWIKVDFGGWKTDIKFHLNEDVKTRGICEDYYSYGQLVYSSLISYDSCLDDDGAFIRDAEYTLSVDASKGINEATFSITDNGVTATRKIALPDNKYTGMSVSAVTDKSDKQPLLANDSKDMFYITFSDKENGAIYTDRSKNEHYIVYRFVTSSADVYSIKDEIGQPINRDDIPHFPLQFTSEEYHNLVQQMVDKYRRGLVTPEGNFMAKPVDCFLPDEVPELIFYKNEAGYYCTSVYSTDGKYRMGIILEAEPMGENSIGRPTGIYAVSFYLSENENISVASDIKTETVYCNCGEIMTDSYAEWGSWYHSSQQYCTHGFNWGVDIIQQRSRNVLYECEKCEIGRSILETETNLICNGFHSIE